MNTSASSGRTRRARRSPSWRLPIRHSEPTSPGAAPRPASRAISPPRHPESQTPRRRFSRASSPRFRPVIQGVFTAAGSPSSSPAPPRARASTIPLTAASPPKATAPSTPGPSISRTRPRRRCEWSGRPPTGAGSSPRRPPPGPISFPRGCSRSRETRRAFQAPGREPRLTTRWTPRSSTRATTAPWACGP